MKTLSKSLLFTLPTSHHARLDCLCIQEGNLIMENNEEVWKPVLGFEDRYLVSSLGRIKSLRDKRIKSNGIITPFADNRGYYSIRFFIVRDKTRAQLHRIVALAFLENPDKKPCVNHKNGNKSDNRVENLEWVTYKENTRHALITGLIKSKKYGTK